MHSVPLYLPLSKGLDLSKESTLGPEELQAAENVDYAVDGAAKGRPSRSAAKDFAVRDPASSSYGYLSDQAFDATGFIARGLMRLRDGIGERPALGCDGRLFTLDGTHWVDRGQFACARVDRRVNYSTGLTATGRQTMAPDFGFSRRNVLTFDWTLLASDGTVERQYRTTPTTPPLGLYHGTGARCGTTTACVMSDNYGVLYFVYRTNGATSLNMVEIASDARTPGTGGTTGDAPVLCCSYDATHFFLAYRTTTANVLKVLKVTVTGTIAATYTSAAITDLWGIWVDNTSVADNRVYLAFTSTAGTTVRVLNQSMVDQSLDATSLPSGGSAPKSTEDVTIGALNSTTAYLTYRYVATGIPVGDILISKYVTTGPSITEKIRYYGGNGTPGVYWGLSHQPVTVNSRTYVTLNAAVDTSTNTGTWITLDITNLGAPFVAPVLVARGPSQASVVHGYPRTAWALTDSTGWEFPTLDWTELELTETESVIGHEATMGLNRVTFSGPRAAQVGASTVFSGSIPHVVTQTDQCAELGFPFLAGFPGLEVTATSGGAVGIGDYGVQACWKWTDLDGQIYRSAPSPIRTVTIGGGNNTIHAVVTNPLLTERSLYDMRLELYVTDLNPTDDAPHFLQTTVAITQSAAYTSIDINTQPDTTSDSLYVDGGEFAHYHVPGDGGVAVVGRRLWMADAHAAYASKLVSPGKGVGFNDEGSLQVNLPTGAGRIVALENLDDKLIILCERGVFAVQDGGPDNVGVGPDFSYPLRVFDLGVAGPRSSCWTDDGIVFCTAYNATDPSRGGPWLLDHGLGKKYLGRPALDKYLNSGSWTPEVAYSPDRQQLYITSPYACTVTASETGVVVLDLRTTKWSTWGHHDASYGALTRIAVVSGVLWTLGTLPAPFDGSPGSDSAGAYTMLIQTGHLAANGQNSLGWGRVKSITPLAAKGSGAHTVTITAVQDGTRSSNSGGISVAATSADSTWPSTRQAPEWDLPVQKCSSIQVQLAASPAAAAWSAIRLDVRPLHSKVPPKSRS